ncbi:MAG: carboxypeptidase-like regulatory domain-containing protein [Candidatus Kapabacteria bacterium]|nr:carboxypeptidase-like regulatory domain-containing protein [Candidatus Kapabacteria bacterium]
MKNLLFALLCFLIFVSCNNSADPNKKNGSISGKFTNNLSNVKVQIEGTQICALSDSNGRFTLNNVEPGVYDIMSTKNNYDTIEFFGIPFPGNGNLYLDNNDFGFATGNYFATKLKRFGPFGGFDLLQSIHQVVRNFEIDSNWRKTSDNPLDTDYSIVLKGKLDSLPKDLGIILFLSKNPNVSKDNFEILLGFSLSYTIYNVNYNYISHELNLTITNNSQFQNKLIGFQKFKIVLYCANNSATQFIDSRTGRFRWAGLGQPSNIIELPTIK